MPFSNYYKPTSLSIQFTTQVKIHAKCEHLEQSLYASFNVRRVGLCVTATA